MNWLEKKFGARPTFPGWEVEEMRARGIPSTELGQLMQLGIDEINEAVWFAREILSNPTSWGVFALAFLCGCGPQDQDNLQPPTELKPTAEATLTVPINAAAPNTAEIFGLPSSMEVGVGISACGTSENAGSVCLVQPFDRTTGLEQNNAIMWGSTDPYLTNSGDFEFVGTVVPIAQTKEGTVIGGGEWSGETTLKGTEKLAIAGISTELDNWLRGHLSDPDVKIEAIVKEGKTTLNVFGNDGSLAWSGDVSMSSDILVGGGEQASAAGALGYQPETVEFTNGLWVDSSVQSWKETILAADNNEVWSVEAERAGVSGTLTGDVILKHGNEFVPWIKINNDGSVDIADENGYMVKVALSDVVVDGDKVTVKIGEKKIFWESGMSNFQLDQGEDIGVETVPTEPLIVTAEEWRGMAQSDREAWFTENAAAIGVMSENYDEMKVLGGKGLVRLIKEGQPDEYFNILTKEMVTDTVWTKERWDNEVIVGEFREDNGVDYDFDKYYWNSDVVVYDHSSYEEIIEKVQPGTRLVILHLDGHATIWASPEQAAEYAREGAVVVAAAKVGIKGRGRELLTLRAVKQSWEAGKRDNYVEWGSYTDPELGAWVEKKDGYEPVVQFRVDTTFAPQDDGAGRFVVPWVKMPKTKYYFTGADQDKNRYYHLPSFDPNTEAGQYWLDEGVKSHPSQVYAWYLKVYIDDSYVRNDLGQ